MMKKNKIPFVNLILCITMSTFTMYVKAQVYVYPILPETETWKNFKNHSDMLKATKLPAEYINANSADLLQSCLSYPLLFDYMAYNNPYYGFRKVILESNAFSEFIQRKDNGEVLMNYYKNFDIHFITLLRDERKQGNLVFTLTAVEFMLSDSTVLQHLSTNKRNELMSHLRDVIDLKEKNKQIFGGNGIISSLFLVSNILNMSDNIEWKEFCKSNKNINPFMNNYTLNKELLSNLQAFVIQLKN